MPETIPQVVILVLFIIPGFVFSRILGLSLPMQKRGPTFLVLDSLAMSCVNYALLSPVVWGVSREGFSSQHPYWFASLWFIVLFVTPAILALMVGNFIGSPKLRGLRQTVGLIHPLPKAWDYFFWRGRQCWVLATFKDGRIVAGLYSTESFASSYPAEQDLYLERVCQLSPEGRIVGLVEGSGGAILSMADIQLLEFYPLGGGQDDGRKETSEA